MSEKNQEKVREFEVDDKWQPCRIFLVPYDKYLALSKEFSNN